MLYNSLKLNQLNLKKIKVDLTVKILLYFVNPMKNEFRLLSLFIFRFLVIHFKKIMFYHKKNVMVMISLKMFDIRISKRVSTSIIPVNKYASACYTKF